MSGPFPVIGHPSGGYQIPNSVRLRASASAYFSRTFGIPTDQKKWTYSVWVKRGQLSSAMYLLSAYVGATSDAYILLQATDVASLGSYNGAGTDYGCSTSGKFRDPSAHCHLMFVADTANATAASRNLIYVNGAAATVTTSANGNWPINTTTNLNASGQTHRIGLYGGGGNALDGLLSDVYFIDGQALTPSSFGETNSDGVWVPKAYTGTYGNNGFHLDFKDAALTAGSNAGLGKDVSGNGNYWTTNNISVTAGVTYDSMVDTPTNNYATFNGIDKTQGTPTYSEANLKAVPGAATWNWSVSSIPFNSEGVYAEFTCVGAASGANNSVGVSAYPKVPGNALLGAAGDGFGLLDGGQQYSNGTTVRTTSSYTTNTVISVAVKNYRLWWAINGVWQAGSGGTGDPAADTFPSFVLNSLYQYVFACSSYQTAGGVGFYANFGQRPFTYTPPTGFKALCTANLPAVAIPNPRKHFDVKTHTGNGGTQSITGVQFAPDFGWFKSRSLGSNHELGNTITGTYFLQSNTTFAEANKAADGFTSWNSDGVTFNGSGGGGNFNSNTYTYVDWLWKANGAGVSNTDGSITSTVSANQTAGFSIVTYTGTGSNATVGHGLGVAPKMAVIKKRTSGGIGNTDWNVYHAGLTSAVYYIRLNLTNAEVSNATVWNSTAPSSTVLSLGSQQNSNDSGDSFIAYCFAEIPGYSKFGSYTGNGSADGPFVWCGFRPRFVMVKNTQSVGDWMLYDTSRDTYNVTSNYLRPNSSGAEGSAASIDVTAGGFKLRYAGGSLNTAETYIFAAFAENPFGGNNCSPSPAR